MRLIFAALGWIVGLLYGASDPPRADSLWLLIGAAAFTVALLLRRPSLLFFAAAALAIVRLQSISTQDALARFRDGEVVTLDGVIDAAPDARDTRIDLRVRVTHLWYDGARHTVDAFALVQTDRTFDGRTGDTVRASGILITPPELDRFSYADLLARAEIYSILPRARIRILQPADDAAPPTLLIDARNHAERQIAAALPEPFAGLLTGILLGDERGIAPEVRDAFAATGAAHVIAISGFNMAVLGGMIGAVVTRTRLPRLPGTLIALAAIGLYTVFVGASPSVVRAAVMTGVVMVGTALRRKAYLPTSLGFTVIVLSAIDPLIVWNTGFQLSAFAVLGIALFADPLTRRYDRLTEPLPRPGRLLAGLLRESLTVGLAALAFTLPLSALYFGVISPSILIVNLLIAPAQPLIMLIGGLALLVNALAPIVAALVFWVVLLPLGWTVGVVRLFAETPIWTVYPPPMAIAVGFIGVIGAALLSVWMPDGWNAMQKWVTSRVVWVGVVIAALVVLVLSAAVAFSRPDGRLHLYFFDLSNTAALIVTPGGRQIVIDGGQYPSRLLTAIGDRLPFYDRTIDLGILTQPDDVLLGGAAELYDRYTPDALMVNGALTGSPLLERLALRFASYAVVTPEAGLTLDLGDGVTLMVLHADPNLTGESSGSARDAGALVLRLDYREFSALLFGDVASETQSALLASGALSPVTLVQLPGGGENDTLADGAAARLQPAWVVVQGDRLYRRHVPDEAVIAQFGGARLLRTDQAGVIHIATDGVSISGEGGG